MEKRGSQAGDGLNGDPRGSDGLFFEISSVGMGESDWETGRLTRVNRKFCEITGYSKEELLRLTHYELTHPDDRGRNREAYVPFLKGETDSLSIEKRYLRKDGETIWVQVTVTAVKDALGKPVQMLGVIVDVTERRAVEENLRASEAQLRRFISAANEGILHIGADERVAYANTCLERMMGYGPGEMVGLTAMDLIFEEDRELGRKRRAARRGQDVGETYEMRMRGKDGREVWALNSTVTVTREDGTYEGTYTMLSDITQRKCAEEALRRTAERTAALQRVTELLSGAVTVEAVADAVVAEGIRMVGAEAGILYLLEREGSGGPVLRFVRSVGYSEEIVAKWGTIPLEAEVPVTEAGRTGKAIFLSSVEERLERFPALVGALVHSTMRASAQVPLLAGDRVLGVLSLAFTETGALGEDDQKMVLALARQCAVALERARLYESEREARAEAEVASQAKDQFLAVLSHELRTPLNPVVMTVAAMETEPGLGPQLRDDLAMIRRNLELETRLIDDLLDLSRITNGKLTLAVQEVEAHALLRNTWEMVRAEMESAGLRVVWSLQAKNDRLRADPARLQQVFWNLLKNALKFTPAGGVVSLATDGEGDVWKCRIEDTGAGIDPEVLPQIFNAFEQGQSSVTRTFGGMGLGLTISRAITEMHGGTIRAESAGRGQGAAFTVELPAMGGVVDRLLEKLPNPAGVGGTGGAGDKIRVLLVEDHPDTVRAMKRILVMNGFLVTEASSVAGALAVIESEMFDVMVSDVGLPDGTGVELIRELRTRGVSTPAIAVTGFGAEGDVRACREAGFQGHMTKPLDVKRLMVEIRKLVGEKSATR